MTKNNPYQNDMEKIKEELANMFTFILFGEENAMYDKDIETVNKLVKHALRTFDQSIAQAKEAGSKEERKRILSWATQEIENGEDYDRLYEFLQELQKI